MITVGDPGWLLSCILVFTLNTAESSTPIRVHTHLTVQQAVHAVCSALAVGCEPSRVLHPCLAAVASTPLFAFVALLCVILYMTPYCL